MKNWRKLLIMLLCLALSTALVACGGGAQSSSSTPSSSKDESSASESESEEEEEMIDITGTMTTHMAGDDWGAGINSVTLELSHEIDSVMPDTFTVTETKGVTDWASDGFPIIEVTNPRTIMNAYLSDADKNSVDGPSKYVTLELAFTLSEGANINYMPLTGYNTYCDPYMLTVDISDSSQLFSGEATVLNSFEPITEITDMTTDADMFMMDSFEASDGVKYEYAHFEPEEPSTTTVVWLHGMGEGGTENTDPYITLLGNEAYNGATEEMQEIMGGANILVPQSPTYWMDRDGTGQPIDDSVEGSYYVDSLHELIMDYKDKTGSTDIILAGCSNGGFMVMDMAINYGDEYTAFVPICEAMSDAVISDDELAKIKDYPFFFIYAYSDTTVPPALTSIATIDRLKAAGATNLHVFAPESVVDTSGRFTNEDGTPYTYNGHFSWIYFHNNEAVSDVDETPVWNWMAGQIG